MVLSFSASISSFFVPRIVRFLASYRNRLHTYGQRRSHATFTHCSPVFPNLGSDCLLRIECLLPSTTLAYFILRRHSWHPATILRVFFPAALVSAIPGSAGLAAAESAHLSHLSPENGPSLSEVTSDRRLSEDRQARVAAVQLSVTSAPGPGAGGGCWHGYRLVTVTSPQLGSARRPELAAARGRRHLPRAGHVPRVTSAGGGETVPGRTSNSQDQVSSADVIMRTALYPFPDFTLSRPTCQLPFSNHGRPSAFLDPYVSQRLPFLNLHLSLPRTPLLPSQTSLPPLPDSTSSLLTPPSHSSRLHFSDTTPFLFILHYLSFQAPFPTHVFLLPSLSNPTPSSALGHLTESHLPRRRS